MSCTCSPVSTDSFSPRVIDGVSMSFSSLGDANPKIHHDDVPSVVSGDEQQKEGELLSNGNTALNSDSEVAQNVSTRFFSRMLCCQQNIAWL